MDQTSATTPMAAPPQEPQESQQMAAGASAATPSFGARGRLRRRARFLRKARELAYRDLGGLVFNLHRFGQRNDALVLAKLSTLSHIDAELRALESALAEREPLTVLREAGITPCPRCAAIHSGEDRFCPSCGLPMSRQVDLPIAGAPGSVAASPATGSADVGAGPSPSAGAVGTASPPASPSAPQPPSAPAAAPPAPARAPSSDEEPTEIVRPPAGA